MRRRTESANVPDADAIKTRAARISKKIFFGEKIPVTQKIISEEIARVAAESRGEITLALSAAPADAPFPRALLSAALAAGASVAALENVSPEKSIFENLAAPLAAAGISWENARARIAAELRFWFGNDAPETAAAGASAAPEIVALARALVASSAAPVLVAPAFLLTPETASRLRSRAVSENFAVVVAAENFSQASEFCASKISVFYKNENVSDGQIFAVQNGAPADVFSAPAALSVAQKLHCVSASSENVFDGTLVSAGAGEFLAETPLGQIHGRFCGASRPLVPDAENAPAVGEKIRVFLPPEIFHIDAFPPEENFFAIAGARSEISFDGKLFRRIFSVTPPVAGDSVPDENSAAPANAENSACVAVAAQFRQTLEILAPASDAAPAAFAWFFPEDALGFCA